MASVRFAYFASVVPFGDLHPGFIAEMSPSFLSHTCDSVEKEEEDGVGRSSM